MRISFSLSGKSEGIETLQISRHTSEDNIKMGRRKKCEDMDCLHVVLNMANVELH